MANLILSCSIVGRVKDIFKTGDGRQISPFQVEDVLLSEPQGLIVDAVVAGVTIPTLKTQELKGEVPRGWIVLSDVGKKLGADTVIKELEDWYHPKLGHHKWLHGGIEVVDKVVSMTLVFKRFNHDLFYDSNLHCRFPSRHRASR